MAAGEVVWFWIVPQAQVNDATRPADAKLVSTPTSGAQYTAWAQRGAYQGWAAIQGPFTAESAARAANPSGGNELQILGAGAGAAATAPGSAAPALDQEAAAAASAAGGAASPLNALGDVAAALKSFYAALTDGKLWRSVLWVALGAMLMITGILLWLRIPQRAASIAGSVAGAAL